MDIGVADDSLNGIPYEESSESEQEDEDIGDSEGYTSTNFIQHERENKHSTLLKRLSLFFFFFFLFPADMDNDIVKAKRTSRERPMSFTKMDDIKNRWECTSQQGRRESQREARKEEIAGIRSRLFMVSSNILMEKNCVAASRLEKKKCILESFCARARSGKAGENERNVSASGRRERTNHKDESERGNSALDSCSFDQREIRERRADSRVGRRSRG